MLHWVSAKVLDLQAGSCAVLPHLDSVLGPKQVHSDALGRKQVHCAALPGCTARDAAPAPVAGALQLSVQVPSMQGDVDNVGMQGPQARRPLLMLHCLTCESAAAAIRDRADDLTAVHLHKHQQQGPSG